MMEAQSNENLPHRDGYHLFAVESVPDADANAAVVGSSLELAAVLTPPYLVLSRVAHEHTREQAIKVRNSILESHTHMRES